MAPKTLNIVYAADSAGVSRALDRMGKDHDGLAGKISKFGKAAALGIAGVAAAAGAMAVKIGVDSVAAFSDLEEAGNKVNVVFGEGAAQVQKWASGAATALGQSTSAALSAAGGFGNLFVQLGFAKTEAANMSTGIVELAADLGSFHNADITTVIEAQSAAFRGEYDSIQQFLPLINAATVETKALEMTGKANTASLTEQEKAVAVLKLMYEGAGPALGDFERSSGSIAQTQRQVKASIDNVKAAIGEVLVKTALPAFIEGLTGGSNKGGDLAKTIDDLAPKIRAAAGDVRQIASDIGGFIRRVSEAIDRVQRLIAQFDRLKSRLGFHVPTPRITQTGGGNFGLTVSERAGGGPVKSGSPYVVGEKGPELFIPDRGGSIVPNGARTNMRQLAKGSAGGVTVNVAITHNGMLVGSGGIEELSLKIQQDFRSYLRANGKLLF